MEEVGGIPAELWLRVRRALDRIIPYYDRANRIFSLLQDWRVRVVGVKELTRVGRTGRVLDLGGGPGTLEPILSRLFRHVVELDASVAMLLYAKRGGWENVDFVQAVFEFLPFRRGCLDAAIASFSLRDSFNLARALHEIKRAIRRRLVIVDVGRPNRRLIDKLFSLYLKYVVPLLTMLATGWIKENPWSLIYNTYMHLPRNLEYTTILRVIFGRASALEFFLGAAVVMVAEKHNIVQ